MQRRPRVGSRANLTSNVGFKLGIHQNLMNRHSWTHLHVGIAFCTCVASCGEVFERKIVPLQ